MNDLQRFQPASANVLGKVIDDEAVVMNITTGNYYSLEAAGAVLWKIVECRGSVAEMQAAILAEFEVDAGQARRDLEELLAELLQEGLIAPVA